MLLFETPEVPATAEEKPELHVVASYLDEEHVAMLDHLCVKGRLSKSDAMRQCLRLGYRTLIAKEAVEANSKSHK